MTRWQIQVLVTCTFSSLLAAAQTAPQISEPRGELLYSTYCTGCHTTEVHWRDKKLATSWVTLKEQVRRWSTNTGLAWGEGDILAVTRHLNTLYYHFPDASGQVSHLSPAQSPRAMPPL
jgi:mono/diheme cytochrome c family protein